MGKQFDQLMRDIEAEAVASGPEGVRRAQEFDDRYTFANQLLEARKAKGWTQVELAEISGIEQPMISVYERGLGNPTLETMAALSRSLGGRGAGLLL